MEKYKKTLQIRVRIMSIYVLGLVLFTINSRFFMPLQTEESMLKGFQEGLLSGMAIVFLILVLKYSRALKDEILLKKLYLKSKDERKRIIMDKSGGYVIIVCSVIILVAGIIGGYFNKSVFYSLVGCAYFLLSIKIILKVYYMKKY